MSHLDEEVLLDLSLETLPPAQAQAARAHLAGCADCAAASARVTEEQQALGRALGQTPRNHTDLEERIKRRVRAEPLPRRARRGPRILAAAAALLAAAGAWAYLNQPPPLTPRQAMLEQVRSSELMALGLGGE